MLTRGLVGLAKLSGCLDSMKVCGIKRLKNYGYLSETMELSHYSALSGPLVSVILPVYNRAEWVARAIRSVLAQTYQNFELLVVDDGSTDGTASVLNSFKSHIKVLRQSHAGAEVARNLGLAHARGEFVAFIDSDDVWYVDRLSSQLPLFAKAEVGLVFGNAALVDYRQTPPRHLQRTFFDGVRPSRGRVTGAFARGCFVPCSSVITRLQCFVDAGNFKPGHKAADYLKWLEISAKYEFDYVPDPVFEYTIHEGGITHDLLDALEDRFEAFRAMLEQNRDAEIENVLRRIVFTLSLNLRLARLRHILNARGVMRPAPALVLKGSRHEKLDWSLKFACNQFRTRVRWWLLLSIKVLREFVLIEIASMSRKRSVGVTSGRLRINVFERVVKSAAAFSGRRA
ncbi:MAG: glycosyltransferase family 2 protein [Pyrinomonadaceae bacterium]